MYSTTNANTEKYQSLAIEEQARKWMQENPLRSEEAHSELVKMLKSGPVHPSALGSFRVAYKIPKPIGGWIALLDDIERLSAQQSCNGQPVVGLKDRFSDPMYWTNYRCEVPDSHGDGTVESVPDGNEVDVQVHERMALWIKEHVATSDFAHNHLRRILKSGPLHPAGLGEFRKKYEIPKPILVWVSFLDDIVMVKWQESPKGQQAIGLKSRVGDPDYWRGYRTICPIEGTYGQISECPVARSSEWRSLGLNGGDPGAIRAEIFRAFVLSNYGESGADMVQACSKFLHDSSMSFREFFGGLSARDVSFMEWGGLYCLWVPTSSTEMKVIPVGAKRNCSFSQPSAGSMDALVVIARSKVPERIDFDKFAAEHRLSRESVLAAYVLALSAAFAHYDSGPLDAGSKVFQGASKKWTLLFRVTAWMRNLLVGSHSRYLKKWERLLLSRVDQDGLFYMKDGQVVQGRLTEVDDDYYKIETIDGTELVKRSRIKKIKSRVRHGFGVHEDKSWSVVVGAVGIGRIKAWRADKKIGFIDDSKRTYFFHKGLVAVDELVAQLESGTIWQTVRFTVVADAKDKKYPSVRILEILGGAVSDYAKGRHAWNVGDFATARDCFQKELNNHKAINRFGALRDLSELMFRTDKDPDAAIALIEKYRTDFLSDSEQSSLDKISVGYFQRANRYSDAENLIDTILQTRKLSPKQREYYNEAKRRAHSAIIDSTGERLFEDVLMSRKCDFHGLEGQGISKKEDLTVEEGGENDARLLEIRKIFKANWDRFCEDVPLKDRKLYRSRSFSEEQLRYQLTDVCLLKAARDEVAADYSLRFYFWRKAQCLLFDDEKSSTHAAFAYLILTARLMAPSRYWHTVLPLVIFYAAMDADAEELRRIVEDEDYRNSVLEELPIDENAIQKVKSIVERLELNKMLPEFNDIFSRLGLPINPGEGEYSHLTAKISKKIDESSNLLSQESLIDLRSFMCEVAELEDGDALQKEIVVQAIDKAIGYISAQGYEGRSRACDDIRRLLGKFEESFLLSNLLLTAIDFYYPVIRSICDAVAEDFSRLTEESPDTEFMEIDNPYLKYERHPATGKFFVGRESKLKEIAAVFDVDVGGQCYILYGQRRSGKTSMLNNLEKKLGDDRFVYTKINASALLPGDGEGGILRQFTNELESKFMNDLSESAVMPNSSLSDNYMSRLRFMSHYVQNSSATECRRWIVGIDEFTYLYDYYLEDCEGRREKVRTFLRSIKALLEEQLFHLLIIGQESVIQMQRTFTNEFAIWRPHRLSYLDENSVKDLVDAPIAELQDNGEKKSRYRGNAFSDLFRLTGGQPWFTQMFCIRMVEYLNTHKISDITGSVIFAVARSFCEGDEKLPSEQFEPFVNLMNPDVDEESVVHLYYSIAKATVNYSDWMPLDNVLPAKSKEVSLLEKRGIIIVKNGGIRLRMGLFAMWLRANPDNTRESFGGKIA